MSKTVSSRTRLYAYSVTVTFALGVMAESGQLVTPLELLTAKINLWLGIAAVLIASIVKNQLYAALNGANQDQQSTVDEVSSEQLMQ